MVIERYIDKEGEEVHAGRPMHFPHMFCGYKINEPSERVSSRRAGAEGKSTCDLCYRLVREMIPRGLPTFLPGRD
jgi:hypothetical protein